MSDLLYRIERHLRRSATPPTTFGRRVANDPRLVSDLRQGREIGAPMAERLSRYLTECGA